MDATKLFIFLCCVGPLASVIVLVLMVPLCKMAALADARAEKMMQNSDLTDRNGTGREN